MPAGRLEKLDAEIGGPIDALFRACEWVDSGLPKKLKKIWSILKTGNAD